MIMKTAEIGRFKKRLRGARRKAESQDDMDKLLEDIIVDIFEMGYSQGGKSMKRLIMQMASTM